MRAVPPLTRVFPACGVTDMRKGFDGLAVLVQQVLAQNPHSGALFVFRGKRGRLVKLLWFDGQGLCLFSKRLDRGSFVWPVIATGTVTLTPEMLDIVPVRWRVVRNVRPEYSCRSCEKIVQAPAPVSAIARVKATFATLAHVVSKFDNHLPLYRQAETMAAQGLDIDRSTLAGWTGQAAALLDPIVTRIRDEVLKADKIHADDTPVPVLDPGRSKTATGRLWAYAADDRTSGSTAPRATWYRFTPDRTAAHPMAHLAGFRGFLQTDAYAGYDGLYRSGVTEVACWAHFRRKVFDMHERIPTPLTADILERIGALYAVEAEARGQPPDVRCRTRQERSLPLVDTLREVLHAALRCLSPKSEMAGAIAYGTKRWPALCQFLDDGGLEIDDNIAERALRGIAMGRRNWLFAGSRAGGERAARHLHHHPDLQGQRRRLAGLYRRRHRQGRRQLAREPLGRTHAVELYTTGRSANRASRIICGLHAALTNFRPPHFSGRNWRFGKVPDQTQERRLLPILQMAPRTPTASRSPSHRPAPCRCAAWLR
jgi:transposase